MLFEGSGIDPDVAAERGYYTARRRSEVPEAFADYQRRLGLVVPMYSPDGTHVSHQLRPDRPRGEKLKYETPAGSKIIIDVHPRVREEVRHGDGELWVVEGVKKADALVSRGIPAVALSGVWMAHVAGSKGAELLPCWDHVNLERRVVVAFDSDWRRKAEVHDALKRIVGGLEGAGAEVGVAYLNDAPDGSKVGVDDFLVAGGTVAELRMLCGAFEAQDVARARLSRDGMLRALVEDLGRRWWAEEWKGRGGHSDRDIAHVMIQIAAERGKIHADGIRFPASWGELQVKAKVARRTLAKGIERLEARGFGYRDNEGRKPDKTGAFVLRAKVDQYGGPPTQATTELQACDPGGLHSRAPSEVPRLRYSRPGFTPKRGTVYGTRKVRESVPLQPRPRIERLGKIRGALVDALVVAGGSLALEELAETLHRKRPRDVRRRDLPWLEEAGILTVEDGAVALTENWSGRLDEVREAGGEIEADELAERGRRRKSRAFHARGRVKASPHYANVGADGYVGDLRPVEEPEENSAPASRPREKSPEARTILGYLSSLGRIRLALLEQIWLEDHGGDLKAMREALDEAGVRRECLREFGNAEFLFPGKEVA